MNIMDVPVGRACMDASGERFEIVGDKCQRKPGFGTLLVRTTKRLDGTIATFIRGIEVTMLDQE